MVITETSNIPTSADVVYFKADGALVQSLAYLICATIQIYITKYKECCCIFIR